MSFDVSCKACGRINPLGRLYCMDCGTKLEITERSVAQARDPSQPTRLRVLAGWLRKVVLLGLLASLVLMLIPVEGSGRVGSRQDASEMARKLNTLYDAVMENQRVQVLLVEQEINAYGVEKMRVATPVQLKWMNATVQSVNFQLNESLVVVNITAVLGPARITREMVFEPMSRDGRVTFALRKLRVGRMPVPEPLASWVVSGLGNLFSMVQREASVLERLAELEIKTDRAMAITGGP